MIITRKGSELWIRYFRRGLIHIPVIIVTLRIFRCYIIPYITPIQAIYRISLGIECAHYVKDGLIRVFRIVVIIVDPGTNVLCVIAYQNLTRKPIRMLQNLPYQSFYAIGTGSVSAIPLKITLYDH